MDFLTQQFIVAAKHLRDEVSALRKSLDRFRDQQQEHYQQQEQQNLPKEPLRIDAEIHEREAGHRNRRENLNLGIQSAAALGTMLAFFATAYYACMTRRTLEEVKQQTPAIQQSAEAAKSATEIAEVSERPWIEILDIKTLGNGPIIPAPNYQGFGRGAFPTANRQVTLQLKVPVKNIGHSVAQLDIDAEMFLPLWNATDYTATLQTEQKRFCDSRKQTPPAYPLKRILFPDRQFESSGAVMGVISQSVVNHTFNNATVPDYILLAAIVCANYRFPGSSKPVPD